MIPYINTLDTILKNGTVRKNRTGIDTIGVTHFSTEYDLKFGKQLPIVTTKRLPTKSVLGELLGFIRGLDNAAGFRALGSAVWNANANEEGKDKEHPNPWLTNPTRKGKDDLGRIYGVQWRKWEDTKIRIGTLDLGKQGYTEVTQFMEKDRIYKVWTREIDQLADAINALIKTPTNRRIIISAWNPGDMNEMALPPCHILQHYICERLNVNERLEAHIADYESRAVWEANSTEGVREKIMKAYTAMIGKPHDLLDDIGAPIFRMDLVIYQRSADYLLGSPYNITSYGMMLSMMARMTGHAPGSLFYDTGDTHVYENHLDAAHEQRRRIPRNNNVRFIMDPKLQTLKDFERSVPEDFRIFNYQNLGKLNNPTPMAV